MTRWMAGLALVALAGCGDGGSGGGTTAAAAPDGWNALDACASVDKAAVAAATGSAVSGTELGPKNEAENGGAAFSMCTFSLASGAKLTVLTREAPDGEGIDAAIAEARKAGQEFGSPAVDVAGLGRAAMWTAKPPALQLFLDDRRYATISLFGANAMPDASDAAREAATRVARSLVS